MIRKLLRSLSAGFIFSSICVLPAAAQVLYGSAVGTVQDPTGGLVANAAISVTSRTTGAVRETVTDTQGRFAFSNLLPSSYDLKVSAVGFRAFTQTSIEISLNNVTRLDVKLELGQLAEQVTVEANAVTLQTDKSDVRSEVTSKAVGNLPLAAYRNFQNLIDLVPGATPANFQNSVGSTPARALTTKSTVRRETAIMPVWTGLQTYSSGCRTTWSMCHRRNRSARSTSPPVLSTRNRGWPAGLR